MYVYIIIIIIIITIITYYYYFYYYYYIIIIIMNQYYIHICIIRIFEAISIDTVHIVLYNLQTNPPWKILPDQVLGVPST